MQRRNAPYVEVLCDWIFALNYTNKEKYDRNHEKDMNKPSNREYTNHTKKPQYEKHEGDC